METLERTNEKKGVNKILLLALFGAAVLVVGAVYLLSLNPSTDEKRGQLLAASFQEGSPEFERLTKDIIVQTDMDNIMQSPTGMGTIMMTVHARIRNKGDKTISILETKVGVVDLAGKVVREKKVLIVPNQTEKLSPGQTIPVVAIIEGFKPDDDRANVRWKVTAIRAE